MDTILALSPQFFPAYGWLPGEEATSKECNNYVQYCKESAPNASKTLFNFNAIDNFDNSPPSTTIIGDLTVVKKLNHNASERDRRKKINSLYATLRSLLPDTDHTKKLSIPQTISRVLNYMPELQQQVERLAERKEGLISKISRQDDHDLYHQDKKRKRSSVKSSLATVLASRVVGDQEVVVQISAHKFQKCSLSDILLVLEEERLLLINASSSESFQGRIFYNLHLQVQTTSVLDCEVLSEKLLSLYEKRQEVFL